MPLPPRRGREFLFIRHGETDWNRQRKAQGGVDVPLNLTGVLQARRAAARLRASPAARPVTRIIASPLSRAYHTAALIAERLHVPVFVDSDLSEARYGVLEGCGNAHGSEFAAFWRGDLHPEGGEHVDMIRARVLRGLAAALDGDGVPLVVAHGGVWRILAATLSVSPIRRLPNATPMRVVYAAGAWRAAAV